jgi:hypothetical protein
MKMIPHLRHAPRVSLAVVVAAIAVASTAPTAMSGGLPPSFGKLSGQVKGAAWSFQGKTGTQYNVTGIPAACSTALKIVAGLTRQTPHSGALGINTLVGSNGLQCAGSGIPLAHAGLCGSGAKHFVWPPRLA